MEEQNPNHIPETHLETAHAQTTNQTPPPSHEHSKKKLILAVLGVIILLAAFSGAFYYMGMNKNNSSDVTSNTNVQTANSPIPTEASTSVTTGKNLVPITANTVSYGYQGDNLLMKYRDKVYSYNSTNNNINEPEIDSKYPNITWYGLIDAPQSVTDAADVARENNGVIYDEVFDFMQLPNNDFAFIMRWDQITGDQTNWEFPIYYFDTAKQYQTKLSSYTWPNNKENPVPMFNSISPDSKNIAFNMYGCWNCGAGYPEIKLLNVSTKSTKNLGQVLEFKWTENNTYSYKEYKEIECKEPGGPGPCLEDSKNLPLKTGNF